MLNNYLSNCCNTEVLYGSKLYFDATGSVGVCSSCHEYTGFHEDVYSREHDCEFISMCCGASPVVELDDFLTGLCGSCSDGTGFECEVDEHCTNNTEVLLGAYNRGR